MTVGDIVSTGNKKQNVFITDFKESQIIIQAMEDYCKANPKKKIAKDLCKLMTEHVGCY